MTLDQAVQYFNGLPHALEYELRRAEADNLRLALELATIHSSGPIRTRQLRAEGHPYARRHGRARRDPSVINTQTGAFASAWQTEGPTDAGGGLVSALFNTDPKAPFLEFGTRFMFSRPLPARVLRELAPRRVVRIAKAIGDAFGP